MSEEATPESAPVAAAAPETAEQVWERTAGLSKPQAPAPAPITKEEVRGSDPNPDTPALPDRALVTGQLSQILQGVQPAPVDPIAERLAALEDSMVPKAKPENPAVYREIQALREELAERDRIEAERVEAEEREARVRTLREGFVESLRETEDFPAIKAAGYEEKLFDTILSKQQAGEDVSEAELLSKTEAELWGLYETLHALKSPTTSEEPQASEAPEPQTPTLTPSLTATDTPRSLEDIYEDTRHDRKAAAREVWDNMFNR